MILYRASVFSLCFLLTVSASRSWSVRESGTSILRAAIMSFRLSARPLEGGTRVAEGVKGRVAERVDRNGRPVDVVDGAVAPDPIASLDALDSADDEEPASIASACFVAKASTAEGALDGPGGGTEAGSTLLAWGESPDAPASLEGSSSASELVAALALELALGARFRAFSCIARHRSRCCSGSRTTGGAERADDGGRAGGAGTTGLEERSGTVSAVLLVVLAVFAWRLCPVDSGWGTVSAFMVGTLSADAEICLRNGTE